MQGLSDRCHLEGGYLVCLIGSVASAIIEHEEQQCAQLQLQQQQQQVPSIRRGPAGWGGGSGSKLAGLIASMGTVNAPSAAAVVNDVDISRHNGCCRTSTNITSPASSSETNSETKTTSIDSSDRTSGSNNTGTSSTTTTTRHSSTSSTTTTSNSSSSSSSTSSSATASTTTTSRTSNSRGTSSLSSTDTSYSPVLVRAVLQADLQERLANAYNYRVLHGDCRDSSINDDDDDFSSIQDDWTNWSWHNPMQTCMLCDQWQLRNRRGSVTQQLWPKMTRFAKVTQVAGSSASISCVDSDVTVESNASYGSDGSDRSDNESYEEQEETGSSVVRDDHIYEGKNGCSNANEGERVDGNRSSANNDFEQISESDSCPESDFVSDIDPGADAN